MYQRLMNKLDVDIWQKGVQGHISDDVIGRVWEQINILDEAYGSKRGSVIWVDIFFSLVIKLLMMKILMKY